MIEERERKRKSRDKGREKEEEWERIKVRWREGKKIEEGGKIYLKGRGREGG